MPIVIELPDGPPLEIDHLALDFTGTLSTDGRLLPGVAERLVALSENVTIAVMTADTCGTAVEELEALPVEVHVIRKGLDKASIVSGLPAKGVAAIGNGRNDLEMLKVATLGIAVIGAEGAAAELLRSADVVAQDIVSALDLFLRPLRLVATLRE